MRTVIRLLRAAGLLAAVLVLPCCRDQIGRGDRLKSVIVRASLNLSKIEPDSDCSEVAISANGRFVVFSSKSHNITANDNNGLRDIFLRDRETGEIVNLTNVLLFGEFPQYAPADCFEPAVSDDGNFIVFSSTGGWVPYTAPASTNPDPFIYRYNRAANIFERAYVTAGPRPNGFMQNPSISADGQIVAFVTNASNLVPANVSGADQIYVHNFNTGTGVIASRKQSPAGLNVPCNDTCRRPRLSSDGGFVVFESDATDLSPITAAAVMPQVYRGTSAGGYCTVLGLTSGNVLSADRCFLPDISAGGQFAVFHAYDHNIVTPAPPASSSPLLVRRDILNGTTDLVTEKPAPIPFLVFNSGYATSISEDGRIVAFLSREDALAGGTPLNFKAQVFVRDMQTGVITFCSRHLDGTPSNIDCDPPRLSADGKWVAWATRGSTLVDGDTNGVSDIFLRGPLR